MIVLDADVLIAFLDAEDVHHDAARVLLEDHLSHGFVASALTVAEVLVHPVRAQRDAPVLAALNRMGLEVSPLTEADAVELARVRAAYRIRMPDAVVLYTALRTQSALATFDGSLASIAESAGVAVVGRG